MHDLFTLLTTYHSTNNTVLVNYAKYYKQNIVYLLMFSLVLPKNNRGVQFG